MISAVGNTYFIIFPSCMDRHPYNNIEGKSGDQTEVMDFVASVYSTLSRCNVRVPPNSQCTAPSC